MPKRALVAYCVDVDCCAPWLCTGDGKPTDATSISRGVFGANVGLDRLLRFFKTQGDIKATFNIPSHTIESFPTQVAKIRDAGHEIGLHGYMHEPPSLLTEDQERAVLTKSIEVYKRFVGRHPKGYIAPNWQASTRTIQLLEEYGIDYDHSLMAHDCQPHWAADYAEGEDFVDFAMPAESWMRPMGKVRERNVVEIPGNWDCTDFAALNFVPQSPNSHGYVDPHLIERNWKEMFTWWYHEYNGDDKGAESNNPEAEHEGEASTPEDTITHSKDDNINTPQGFVFSLTIHPQSSGKPHVLAMHERFVKWLREEWEGVEFVTCEQVAREFREGKLGGAGAGGSLECGV